MVAFVGGEGIEYIHVSVCIYFRIFRILCLNTPPKVVTIRIFFSYLFFIYIFLVFVFDICIYIYIYRSETHLSTSLLLLL